MSPITATLWLTVGLSFYGGDFVDQPLYCGETYTKSLGDWAAVPIEWFKGGWVHCGDTITAILSDGSTRTVPIRDAGCHLHHPVWDTGLPFGADFPIYHRDRAPTGTGQIAIKRATGQWLTISPLMLVGWDVESCDGPLSMRVDEWLASVSSSLGHMPN